MEPRQAPDISKPAVVFSQSSIEADGLSISYGEAGQGDALVCLQDGGLRLSRAHELMAQRRRLIAFEIPGSSHSQAKATSPKELADTMHTAVGGLGIDHFSIMADSSGAELALRMAIANPQRVAAVVLLAPPAIHATERSDGDDEFETSLSSLETPVLVMIGTYDPDASSAGARIYREKLRNFHLVMVYGAGAAMDSDRPEAVAALVDDFLARGGSFIVRNRSGMLFP